MPGPFPGMDPWLEQHWGDVHTSIVTYCRDRLQAGLPRELRARVEERVVFSGNRVIESSGIWQFEQPRVGPAHAAGEAMAVLDADPALKVKPFDEETVERFIEIRDFSTGGRLVTVIEILSPANKIPGRGRVSYLQKRKELHAAQVSLVEIDLLRSGEPIDAIPRSELPEEYHTPYLVTVSRECPPYNPREYEIYKVPLQRRLPRIGVPLRPSDPDVLLDLQAVLDDAYDRGGYDILDYRTPPKPPLTGELAQWADRWLREKGLRPAGSEEATNG